MPPKISTVECIEFEYDIENIGTNPDGFTYVYDSDSTLTKKAFLTRIQTDEGVTGEYVTTWGGLASMAQIEMVGDYLLGRNPLSREKHWRKLNWALRKFDKMGLGPIDIALWDFAGNYYSAPVHEIIGSYRESFPAYASTYPGDQNGGLDSPEAYADFAEECLEMGYQGFKLHIWGSEWYDIEREIETVQAVGTRVGDEMDLMLDPAGQYNTLADAIRVGKACDEQSFLWYEDPYADNGTSQHGSQKLREILDTPMLQTEQIRGIETHTDFAINKATDFLRADPEYDAGITGTMKLAHIAEGMGLDIELHLCGPAHRHCIAAMKNSNYYELGLVHPLADNTTPHIYDGDYSDDLDTINQDGLVSVPNGPGLGVDYDVDYIKDNQTRKITFD